MPLRGGKSLRIMESLSASMMSLDFCPKVGGSLIRFLSNGMIWSLLYIGKIPLIPV